MSQSRPESPNWGELWWADLDPVVGTEQGRKIRPVVVISDDELNHSRLEKIVIVPSTTQARDVPWRVEWAVRTPSGTRPSFFCCDDVRSVSIERLRGRIDTGRVPQRIIEHIEHVLERDGYDLEVDTTNASTQVCAQQVIEWLQGRRESCAWVRP